MFFTLAPAVTRLMRAVQAARLLQAAVPVSATFAAPFCVRPDPDEDDVFQVIGSSFASWRTGDEGQHDHRRQTAGAPQGIDVEHAAQQLTPGEPSRTGCWSPCWRNIRAVVRWTRTSGLLGWLLGLAALGCRWRRRRLWRRLWQRLWLVRLVLGVAQGWRNGDGLVGWQGGQDGGRGWGQQGSEAGAIGEQAMVAGQVEIWSRDEGADPSEQRQWLEDQLRFSGRRGPGTPELVVDTALRVEGEAVHRERGPETITAEAFEPLAIVGADAVGGL